MFVFWSWSSKRPWHILFFRNLPLRGELILTVVSIQQQCLFIVHLILSSISLPHKRTQHTISYLTKRGSGLLPSRSAPLEVSTHTQYHLSLSTLSISFHCKLVSSFYFFWLFCFLLCSILMVCKNVM